MTVLSAELDQRLRDLITVHRELVTEVEAIGYRIIRAGDELERLADELYADAQDADLEPAAA